MMIRHVKIIEAGGVALVLLAWILNWWSIEKWNREDRSLAAFESAMTTNVSGLQTTANVRLEAAVSRELARHGEVSSNREETYAQAWRSEEVRERWLTVQVNSLWGLRELMSYFLERNKELDLLSDSVIMPRWRQLEDLYIRLDKATGSKGIAPDNVPKIADAAFPATLAAEIESALLQGAAEPVFQTYSDLQRAIQTKSRNFSLSYSFIFLIGSVLAVLAKLVEWRRDVRAK